MPPALKSRAKLLVLIVFSVWSIWSVAAPHALTTVSRQQFTKRLVAAAIERIRHPVRYISDYVRIPYANGDVPADTGVCTDEIIRSYRAVGVDLQKEVHEDMVRNFSAYPNQKRWGLDHPDSDIDHRRVPNLMVFFQRKGETLPNYESSSRLCSGRSRHLGLGPGCAAYWHRCGSEGPLERPIQGGTPHRSRPENGGCSV